MATRQVPELKPIPLAEDIEGGYQSPVVSPETQKARKEFEFAKMDEHAMPLEDLMVMLGTSQTAGLTESRARELNLKYGDNMLTEHHKTPWYVELILEMLAPFSLLLWAGAALSSMAYILERETKSHVIFLASPNLLTCSAA
jgi:magnesium-transporting ATPase (P-type)